ncbi:hypothetical protein V6N13_094886 [Hibiscus sabdariffa]|uniref:Uncharacterized protein n=1 Tax=Hibiscus sabdariffa TaxID=183260 RepID=A0ABR2PTL6_9ROSI
MMDVRPNARTWENMSLVHTYHGFKGIIPAPIAEEREHVLEKECADVFGISFFCFMKRHVALAYDMVRAADHSSSFSNS